MSGATDSARCRSRPISPRPRRRRPKEVRSPAASLMIGMRHTHSAIFQAVRMGPPFFSHVFVITIIRPSQKETSPPVNPRSGLNFFRSARPNHRKSKSYVYFEPSTRDLIGPRISTSALFSGGYLALSKTVTSTELIMINPQSNS